MENGENHDKSVIYDKTNLIREPADEGPANRSINLGKLTGVVQDIAEGRPYALHELKTQAGVPFLIPIKGLGHLRLRFRTDDELMAHRRPVIRSRTRFQGDPSFGFL